MAEVYTLCQNEEIEEVRTALAELSKREYDILCRSAGVECDKKQSLSEIGKAYGISKERVRQIRGNAVLKIKRILFQVA
jgi:RNA polymerase sigma factor (sigma-70 family)